MFDADTFAQGTPEPFRLVFTVAGQGSFDEVAQWVEQRSSDGFKASERLHTRFNEDMARLCQRLAEGFRPQPDENASLHFSRPVFKHILRTGQRSRLRSSGVYYVFVRRIRHR